MTNARERLVEIVRGMRQQQEQQSEAETLWRKALPRCETLAREIVEIVRAQGVHVSVVSEDGQVKLDFADRATPRLHGARCRFMFNRQARSVGGYRVPFLKEGGVAMGEHFFSLTVAPPVVRRVENAFGPSGGSAPPLGVDSQEAFERAVVDFLEWAMVKEGCGGVVVQLP